MTKDTTKEAAVAAEVLFFDNWAGTARRANDGAPRFPAYQRRTRAADALIAGHLSCRNQHAAGRRALAAAFSGSVGKDVVSRAWRKVKGDWDAWNARSLVDEPVVRLILDGTVARVRLDKKATSVSLLVALGVRADGQKVLLTRALSLPRSSSIGTPYTAGQRS